ncbi:uncharacterized protein LOC129002686 [Macrosteles quadrilineatus]|uniref:uncharacterized protein LOC129002686 n=1 Tax=Macrosteles quadrilineatus TaxID=74068 RepID=UPI0023E26B23|nr:uncharacterized protein LOC129002686 [Macrosteles quadrilineatus]
MEKTFCIVYVCLTLCAKMSQQIIHDDEMVPDYTNDHVLGLDPNFNETDEGIIDDSSLEANFTYYNSLLNETWLNLASVMDLFTQREYDNSSAVQALTAAFRYTLKQQKKLKNPPAYLKKPFITIEGMDVDKRNMLAGRLAQHINGHVVPNPPDTFEVVLKHLPDNSTTLINGYYVLNTYIAALHARYAIQTAPAVIPGYWLGRSALTVATHFVDKPPPFKSKFWEWPRDLVKPDVIFYITDRQFMKQYEDRKLVRRYLHIFDNWADPKCIPLVNCESIDSMIEEIEPYLQELLVNRLTM